MADTGTVSLFSYFKRKRNSSSTSSNSTSSSSPDPKKQKDNLEETFTDIKEAEEFEENMAEANIVEIISKEVEKKLESIFDSLKEKIREEVKNVVENVMKRFDGLEKIVDKIEKENMELKRRLVELEQYGRRANVRIFGVKEETGEDCKTLVSHMLKNKLSLNINEKDIDAAHRLPQRAKDKPKPIIVRFFKRDDQEKVMRARKRLKQTGVSIAEDLCRDLLQLYNRVRNDSSRVLESWVWRGQIFIKDHRNEIHKVHYGQALDEMNIPVMRYYPKEAIKYKGELTLKDM